MVTVFCMKLFCKLFPTQRREDHANNTITDNSTTRSRFDHALSAVNAVLLISTQVTHSFCRDIKFTQITCSYLHRLSTGRIVSRWSCLHDPSVSGSAKSQQNNSIHINFTILSLSYQDVL